MGQTRDDTQNSTTHDLDCFIAWQQAAPGLVDDPERTADGDLPVGHALQVAAELGFAKLAVGLERRRRRQLARDDLRGFDGAGKRAVDNPCDAGRPQPFAERS